MYALAEGSRLLYAKGGPSLDVDGFDAS